MWLFLAAIASAVPFLPAVRNGFVDWDDYQVLVRNERLRNFTSDSLLWMVTTGHMGNWQPIGWLAAAIEYQLFGPDEMAFAHGMHATSIVLHSLVAVLAFLLIRSLLERQGGSDTHLSQSSVNAATLVAVLFFSIHPLRVETVAWATAQPYILAIIWVLVSLLCYVYWVLTGRRGWLTLSFLCFGLSLLCKPIAVPLVAVLPFVDLWLLHPRRATSSSNGSGRRWLDKLPFALAALGAVIMAAAVKEGADSTMSLSMHGPAQRLAQACYGLVFYFIKTILPYGLSPLYELRLPLDLSSPRYVISAAAVIAATILLLVFRRRLGRLSLLAISYAVLLAPVLGFLQSGNQEVADRYSYLPCLTWSILIALLLARVAPFNRAERSRPVSGRSAALPPQLAPGVGSTVCLALATAALLALAALTWRQTAFWSNTAALWTRAVTIQPESSLAQNGYGYVLLEAGHTEEAVRHFRRAIAIRPGNDRAHFNLWIALDRLGRTDELATALEAGANILWNRPEPRAKLANLHFRQREYDVARQWYESALQLGPDDAATRASLAGALYALGDREQAIEQARRALALDRNCAAAHLNLALALRASSQPDQAAAELREVLRVEPENARARELLARWTETP